MAKFCTNCGAELKEGADVCVKCGKLINESGSKAGDYNDNGVINRAKLKEAAKSKLNNNLWNLLIPMLIVALIGFVGGVISGIFGEDSLAGAVVSILVELATLPISVGVIYYYLNFIRGKSYSLNDLIKYYSKFLPIFAISMLVGIFTFLWTLLFIIPGIIAAISYSMVYYIVADNPDIDVMEAIKESKRLTNGYKGDLFVFMLSFIGWYLLVGITFGIAIIYVGPYVSVSQAMYYEELKKIKG